MAVFSRHVNGFRAFAAAASPCNHLDELKTKPLLLFTAAARQLPYSTLGILQFLAPTMQFLLAVLVYGEPFTSAHAIAFAAIWGALGLYILALVRHARASVTVPE